VKMKLRGFEQLAGFADALTDNAIASVFRAGAQMIAFDEKRGHAFKNRTGRFESSLQAWDESGGVNVGPRPSIFDFDGVKYYPIFVADRGYYDLSLHARRGLMAIAAGLNGQEIAGVVPFRFKLQGVYGGGGKQVRMGVSLFEIGD